VRYERHLLGQGIASQADLDDTVARLDRLLADDVAWAEASPLPAPDAGLDGVYADRAVESPVPPLVREWQRRKERG
jgi:TPP-dependent pyruvate/acetoin dehydrogenase alpha subunit